MSIESVIRTHGRHPEPVGDHGRKDLPDLFPACTIIPLWHCGRLACVHTTYAEALAHVTTDRNKQHEPPKS